MSLPIIRLVANTENNATPVQDPLAATITLYTFLRSVPTRVETDLAMADFARSFSAKAAASVLHSTNESVVQVLEAAILDGVMRRPPHVTPAWCRGSERWTTYLHPVENALTANGAFKKNLAVTADDANRPVEGMNETRDSLSEYIPAADFKSFRSPFETYSMEHHLSNVIAGRMPVDAFEQMPVLSNTCHTDVFNTPLCSTSKDDATGLYTNQGFQDAHSAHHDGTIDVSLPTADSTPENKQAGVMVRTSPDTSPGSQHLAASKTYQEDDEDVLELNNRCSTLAPEDELFNEDASRAAQGHLHPVLQRILHCLRSSSSEAYEQPIEQQERQQRQIIQEKVDAVRTKIENAMSTIALDMKREEEEGTLWSVTHSKRKAAMVYVEELQHRVQAAETLFYAQQSEQETIRIAHCAILAEVHGMRHLLREVFKAVADAPKQPCPAPSARRSTDAFDSHLVKEIRAVFEKLIPVE